MRLLCIISIAILACFNQYHCQPSTVDEEYSRSILEWVPYLKHRNDKLIADHQAFFIRRPIYGPDGLYEDASDILITGARWITESHNVTGARFLANFKNDYTVFFMDRNIMFTENLIEASIDNVIIHPAYEGKIDDKHDIAIIKLSRTVKFSRDLQPIEISQRNITDVVDCILMGWKIRFENSDMKLYHATTVASARNFTSIDGHILKSDVIPAEYDYGFWTSTGAPLICEKGDSMFAQGFVLRQTCTKIVFGGKEYCEMQGATYVDLSAQYEWIMDTLHTVDTPSVYHSDISFYESCRQPAESLKIVLNASDIDLWYHAAIYEKVVTKEGRLCIGESMDFDIVQNAYECAIKCFQRNDETQCSYVGSLNKCFYSLPDSDCTFCEAIIFSFLS